MSGIVTTAPRSAQLAGIIRQEIEEGKVKPGERLLPIRTMAEKFGVTHQVAKSAFGILCREGLIASNLGRSGTYVAEAQKKFISGTVISIIETKQENHAQFIGVLPEMLVQKDYMPAIYELGSSIKVKDSIRKLIQDVPKAVIVDGTGLVPHDIFDDVSPETHLVFINHFEGKKNYDASYILSDYTAGGYMAVKHLLELGRKRIMTMTYALNPGWASDLFMRGCRKALKEAGLAPLAIFSQEGLPPEEKLEKIFSSRSRPDGVVSLADYSLGTLGKCLDKYGLKTPEDVAMIGYYNTPWAEALDLTSLSIRADFISVKAVEAIESGEKNRMNVSPEFVFRKSCPEKLGQGN